MATLGYRLRIRNAADDADLLVVSSVPTDANPYCAAIPTGDGAELDPITGSTSMGEFTFRAIDAEGTVAVTTDQTVETFESYADTTALLAAWTETDPTGNATWTLDGTHAHGGSKAALITLNGAVAAGEIYKIEKTVTGLVPGATYTFYRQIYAIGGNTGFPQNAFFDAPTDLVADGSGHLTVYCRIIIISGGTAVNWTWWFDDLRLVRTSTGSSRVVTAVLTDADARQQLLSKRAFIEETEDAGSSWANLTAGYITRVELTDALTFEFGVGDSRRVEQSKQLFERISDPVDHPALIGVMDRASCIIGGPVVGDWGGSADRGRPVFRVVSVTGDRVELEWIAGFLYHGAFHEGSLPIDETTLKFFNQAALDYRVDEAGEDIGGFVTAVPLAGLVVRVYDVATGDWIADHETLATEKLATKGYALRWITSGGHFLARWIGTAPSVGDRFGVAVFPSDISDRNPLHLSGHPADLLKYTLDLEGTAYNETSRLAVRAALGDSLSVEYRITEKATAVDWREAALYGPFGFAPRLNDAGELEFFLSRQRAPADPVSVLTVNDLTSADGSAFRVQESSAVNQVTFKSLAFNLTDERTASTPIDSWNATTLTQRVTADDAEGQAVFGERDVTFEIPGHIVGLTAGTTENPGSLDLWVAAQAAPLFDWSGRGSILGEFHVLRGVTAARIGDEVIHQFAHVPTAKPTQTPTSQRGSAARRAVVLRRTPMPEGVTLLLQDRGLAEILTDLPTFTIAAKDGTSKKIATVTLTNEAAMIAAGVTLRVEWAVQAATPVVGAFLRQFLPGTDVTPFDTPAVDAGAVVWVRMRAETTGSQIGPWTDWASVNLTDLTAPSSLAGTASGTSVALTWKVGETDQPVEVMAHLDGDTAFLTYALLAPGSTAYTLQLEGAATDYVIGVRHHEAPPFNGVSSTATLDIATDVAQALSAPIDPVAFSDGQGGYGLEVTATELEAAVEVWVAVETAAGSLTAGTYEVDGTTASAAVGRTRYTSPTIAANDGLRRFLRARHTRIGWTASPYTAEVSVLPWALTPAPPPDPNPTDTFPAPACFDVDVHSAISATGEPVITSALTELPGHPRVIYDTTGLAQVRLQYQGNAADDAGPAGSLLVAECRPKGSTNEADFAPVGVVAGPTVALDGTPGGVIEGGWFDLAVTSLGDLEFRFLTRDGDDATRFQPKQLRLQFRRALPPADPEDDPGTPPEENPAGGLLAHFLGTAGKIQGDCSASGGLWHKSYTGVTVVAGTITDVTDLSGGGHSLSPYGPGSDSELTLAADALGTIPSVRFQGGRGLRWVDGVRDAWGAGHLFLLLRKLTGHGGGTASQAGFWGVGAGGGSPDTYVDFFGQAQLSYGRAGSYSSPPTIAGEVIEVWHILELDARSGAWKMWRGTTWADKELLADDTGTALGFASSSPGIGASYILRGSYWEWVEWIEYDTTQDDTQRQAVWEHLTAVAGGDMTHSLTNPPGGGAALACLDRWADQSGNGNDAIWVSGAHPADELDRVNLTGGAVLHLPSGMLDGYPVVELYAAVEAAADPGGANDVIWTLGTDPSEYPDSGGSIQEGAGLPAAVNAGNPATTLAALRLYHVRLSAAGGAILLDRVPQATLAPVAALAWPADPTIGGGVTFYELRIYGLQTFHSDADRDAIYAEMVANYPDIPVDPPVPPVGDPGDPLPPVAGDKYVAASAKYNHLLSVPPFTADFGNSLTNSPGVTAKLSYATTNSLHLFEFMMQSTLLQRTYGTPIDYGFLLANLRAAFDDAGIKAAMLTAYNAGVLPGVLTNDDVDLASRWGAPIPSNVLDDYARQIKDVLGFNLPCYVRADPVRLEKRRYKFIYLDGCVAQYTGPLHMGTVSTYIATMLAAASRIQKRVIFATNTVNGGDGSSGVVGSRSGFWFQSATDIRRDGGALAAAIRDGKAERILGTWMRDWASNDDTGWLQRSDIKAAWEYVLGILNG